MNKKNKKTMKTNNQAKYRITVIAFLFVICIAFIQTPVRKFISQKINDKGNYYFNGGEYDLKKAEVFYEKALSFDSNSWEAHYQLSRIFFMRKNFSQATSEIDKAIASDPQNKRSYYVRGLINGYKHNYSGAEKDFKEFIAWSPDEWPAYVDLSWTYINGGNYEKAISLIDYALTKFPDNAWLYSNKGLAEYRSGKNIEAKADLENAKNLAYKLSEEDWINAYPGNNTRNASRGVQEIKTAIDYNLSLVDLINGNKRYGENKVFDFSDIQSLAKYSGTNDLSNGVTLSACGCTRFN
jgi:tetratricopeptide (TPR) repeat protein